MKFYMQAKVCCVIILFCFLFFPMKVSSAQEKDQAEVKKEILDVGDKKIVTERYTIRHGDHLWQILRERDLLDKKDFPELFNMLKSLNPTLQNLSEIEPGDILIIPLRILPNTGLPSVPRSTADRIVPPESPKEPNLEGHLVREEEQPTELPTKVPPEVTPISEPARKTMTQDITSISHQLAEIFTQMGEEWVQKGQHFIPIRSGGEVNLKADSYPIINLSNGNRVIVDLKQDLPEKMSHLITSSWKNYRIVSLTETDDLRSALGKILSVCDYKKIYREGEPFETGKDISVRITADWIVKPNIGLPDESEKVIVITLIDDPSSGTPQEIKKYLKSLGILVIDYPGAKDTAGEDNTKVILLRAGQDKVSLIEMLLNLSDQSFSKKMEIPIYRSQKTDFDLIIKADFLFNKGGKEYIIDLTGLGTDIISLLRQHQFSVLSIPDEKDPSLILPMVLDFMGVETSSGPYPFWTADRDEQKNIRITILGTRFRDHKGQNIFATSLELPEDIINFLSSKGYTILSLTTPLETNN
jgi:hypothetical protein